MPCSPILDFCGKRRVGFICWSPVHHLGRGVWMEWHSYLGPSFYHDKDCQKPMHDWYERPQVVALFEKWQTANPNA